MKNTNATLMLLQCLLSLTKFEEHFNKECLIEDNSKLLKKPKIIQIFKEIVKKYLFCFDNLKLLSIYKLNFFFATNYRFLNLFNEKIKCKKMI